MRSFVAGVLASLAVGCAPPLDQGLDESRAKHWTVVDMKTDWARIFAFESK
jgi:hypothetical protein